jgi:hypothetical protein
VSVTSQYLSQLSLNVRDKQLVRYLSEIGYATSKQLERLFFSYLSHSRVQACRRLLQLWQWHMLERTVGSGLAVYGIPTQLVYSPGPAGILMLSEEDAEGGKRYRRRGPVMLQHNVLLGEALANIDQTVDERGWTYSFYGEQGAYIQFQDESRWVKLRPDGLLFLRHPMQSIDRALLLEMDTSGRETETYTAKIYQYELYHAKRSAWQPRHVAFPYVGIIVWAADAIGLGDKAHEHRVALAEARLQRVMQWIGAKRKDTGIRWLFARLDQVAADEWRGLDEKGQLVPVHLLSERQQRTQGVADNAE